MCNRDEQEVRCFTPQLFSALCCTFVTCLSCLITVSSVLTCCLSSPSQMDNQIVVSDYAQMDRVLREERAYILNMVKQVKKAGCNVLLIQKSILRYLQLS